MNFQTLNKQRKFVMIAALIGIISCFLPWITVSVSFLGNSVNNSINGMRSWGLLAFFAFIGAGVSAFLGNQTRAMQSTFWFIALACGALAAIGVLLFFIKLSDSTGDMGGFGGVSNGFGIYLAALAAIGVLASAYMFRSPGDSIKGGFDSLKGDIEKKTNSGNNDINNPTL